MPISDFAKNYHKKMFGDLKYNFFKTDPEFTEIFANFAFDKVIKENELDQRTRFIIILASIIGCQGIDEYEVMLNAAINFGLEPIVIKEIVYQAVPYLGISVVFPFLRETNRIFEQFGIEMPLKKEDNNDIINKKKKGNEIQKEIFENEFVLQEQNKTINNWLSENCYEDYYSRNELNYSERELIVFCFLMAQGGCENELKMHINGNINTGNSKDFLCKVALQSVPYIGYIKVLNVINEINNL